MLLSTGNSSNTRSGTSSFLSARADRPVRRFSCTVIWLNTSRPCGTQPMPLRARISGRVGAISEPMKLILPLRTGSAPITLLSRVVLPTPFRPIKQTHDPSGTLRSMSHSVWLCP
jgi:hypothetical protein